MFVATAGSMTLAIDNNQASHDHFYHRELRPSHLRPDPDKDKGYKERHKQVPQEIPYLIHWHFLPILFAYQFLT